MPIFLCTSKPTNKIKLLNDKSYERRKRVERDPRLNPIRGNGSVGRLKKANTHQAGDLTRKQFLLPSLILSASIY